MLLLSEIQNTPLPSRAGAIQAAINLEIPGPDSSYLDLRIVGINGQLPNLDLVNLVKMLFIKDQVRLTLFGAETLLDNSVGDAVGMYLRDLEVAGRMVTSCALGSLEGNHGFFQKFNIQSVTIIGVKSSKIKTKIGFLKIAV